MTANPVQAPRYRPGKALAEDASSSSESESESEAQPQKPISAPPKVTTAGGITSNLSKVDLNERRKAAAAKEAARIEEEQKLKAAEEEGFVTEEESEEDEEGSGDEDEESEEESSEEEAPKRVMMRPTFIKKGQRGNAAAAQEAAHQIHAVRAAQGSRGPISGALIAADGGVVTLPGLSWRFAARLERRRRTAAAWTPQRP